MKTFFKTIIISLVVMGIALFTNPSADAHRAAIKQAMSERNLMNKILGIGALTAFVSTYHSYGLASYTEVEKKMISIGAFTKVWVLDQPIN